MFLSQRVTAASLKRIHHQSTVTYGQSSLVTPYRSVSFHRCILDAYNNTACFRLLCTHYRTAEVLHRCKVIAHSASSHEPRGSSSSDTQQGIQGAIPSTDASSEDASGATNQIEQQAPKAQPRLQRLLSTRDRWKVDLSGSLFAVPLQLALKSAQLVRRYLLPLLLLHGLTDIVLLLLNRVNHRITNALAVQLLPSVSAGAIGNPWFLSNNPEVAVWQNGYQPLALFMFLALFPVELVIRSVAMAITGIMVMQPETDGHTNGQSSRQGLGLRGAGRPITASWSTVRPYFRRVFETDVRVALQAIPLRLLCITVIAIPWALPRLVVLQLAQPLALLRGALSADAVTESQACMQPYKWGYAAPYAACFLLLKLLDPLQQLLFDAIPPRWTYELPEIPLLTLVAFAVARLLLARVRDVLPYAMLQVIDAKGSKGQTACQTEADSQQGQPQEQQHDSSVRSAL